MDWDAIVEEHEQSPRTVLAELLEHAEAGRISAVYVLYEWEDTNYLSDTGGMNRMQMLAMLDLEKHRLLNEIVEETG